MAKLGHPRERNTFSGTARRGDGKATWGCLGRVTTKRLGIVVSGSRSVQLLPRDRAHAAAASSTEHVQRAQINKTSAHATFTLWHIQLVDTEAGPRDRVCCGEILAQRTTFFNHRGPSVCGWGVTIKTRLVRTLQFVRPSAAVPRVLPVSAIKLTQSKAAAHPALRAKRRMKQKTKGLPHTLVRALRTMSLQKTKAARMVTS